MMIWTSLRKPLGNSGRSAAVGHAAGEDRVRRGPALAAGEAAGDLADRVHALFEVDGQREEVDVARLRAHAGGDQHHRFAQRDRCRAVGLRRPAVPSR